MPIRVAVIGPNRKVTDDIITDIIRDANEKIVVRDRSGDVVTENGVIYRNLTSLSPYQIGGLILDQLLIVDDFRWEVLDRQKDLIEACAYRLGRSQVPEDFTIQKLEIE